MTEKYENRMLIKILSEIRLFRLSSCLIQENADLRSQAQWSIPWLVPSPFSPDGIIISFTVMTETLLFIAKWTSSSKGSRQSYHFLATQATDFLAASSRSMAEVMGSPLLLRMFWASWTLVPRRWGVGEGTVTEMKLEVVPWEVS